MRSLTAAVTAPGTSVIAEISAAPHRAARWHPISIQRLAAAYEAGGAAAISVLTEPEFFAGSAADLQAAARPLACRSSARTSQSTPPRFGRAGQSATTPLIVAALDDETLTHLIATAAEAGIDALVEVHDDGSESGREACRLVGVSTHETW